MPAPFVLGSVLSGCGYVNSVNAQPGGGTVEFAVEERFTPPPDGQIRYLAFISDTHMGLGQVDGRWHPYEDFRWPRALAGFLDAVSERGEDKVDLIIVGDFLELWQVPDDISCGNVADLDCTIRDTTRIAERVIAAHTGTSADGATMAIDSLRAFSQRGDNRLHLIPGNHDAAILLKPVWEVVARALGASSGRVNLVDHRTKGVWSSHDGKIVVEHGHQMGSDLNRYDDWPIVTDASGRRMIRVGGELNVQAIFNDVELVYSIIDNLGPETVGAWYWMQDRGAWGTIGDLARLAVFLIFEASVEQKADLLRGEDECERDEKGNCRWDYDFGRQLGYKLVAASLPKNDEIGSALTGLTPDSQITELQKTLDYMVMKMTDAEIGQLCDHAYLVTGEVQCDPNLGAIAESIFSSRERVKRNHLHHRIENGFPKLKFFIYGHTHKYESGVDPVELDDRNVRVFNTGAFQQIMDKESYEKRLKAYRGVSTGEGLRTLTLERDFPPCYTAVLIPFKDGKHSPELVHWFMPENGSGRFVHASDQRCKW